MLFSSNVFIFIFLPFVLFTYYIILRKSRRLQNIFLFIASLFFYAWGEPRFVIIMFISIVVNWILGIFVDKYHEKELIARIIIAADVIVNISIIYVFKYLIFTINNINSIFDMSINVPSLALPIGISFYTFQAISYIIDIYRGNGKVQKSLINVGLYISFFPQLIAGPIVRYETISHQILNRKETIDKFSEGAVRFIIGLGKKVIISNSMAYIADASFSAIEGGQLSVAMSWLGIVAYTLQIYFDFSGYSDMAIGLGKMFGFEFLENFNYPYISKTASEFWRRWHISLGTWFKDYVYIPLGGSRVKSKPRHVLNLFVVWALTGIWHGANWTFAAWGMLWFVLISIEKLLNLERKFNGKIGGLLKHIYLLFFVMIGWVVFRADNICVAIDYYQCMFAMTDVSMIDSMFMQYLRQYGVYIIFAIMFSMPIAKLINESRINNILYEIIYVIAIITIFLISVSFIVKGSYNPFIYFNF